MFTETQPTIVNATDALHTEECVLYAVLTGRYQCLADCQELREAFPIHPALHYDDEALRRAAEEREAPFALNLEASIPTMHTSQCMLAAIQAKRFLCLPECTELRRLDSTHPLLRYTDANLAQAAAYGANEPTQVTRECPGCHRTITVEATPNRGHTCPRCGIGIPADLTTASERPPAAVAQVLGWDSAETGSGASRW